VIRAGSRQAEQLRSGTGCDPDAADDLEAAAAALAQRDTPPENHRWNFERIDGGIRICEGHHERARGCEWEYYVPKDAQRDGIPRDDARDDDYRMLDWLSRHWLEVYSTDEQGQPYRVVLNGTGDALMNRVHAAMTSESGEQKSGEESDATCDPSNTHEAT
jgi:hypothetical protein